MFQLCDFPFSLDSDEKKMFSMYITTFNDRSFIQMQEKLFRLYNFFFCNIQKNISKIERYVHRKINICFSVEQFIEIEEKNKQVRISSVNCIIIIANRLFYLIENFLSFLHTCTDLIFIEDFFPVNLGRAQDKIIFYYRYTVLTL